jgi:hypothetical protein
MSMAHRHFLDIDRIDAGTLRRIVDMGHAMKKAGKRGAGETQARRHCRCRADAAFSRSHPRARAFPSTLPCVSLADKRSR